MQELSRLPGIGPRTAQRLAFHLLDLEPERLHQLATVLLEVKTRLRRCQQCANVSEGEQCEVCADPRRDRTRICVVEE
ncbi:MAG: recombination protein RecR, partial [Deinococcus sp.]|nr:recombination protein RecR [Deinococcus sp.]